MRLCRHCLGEGSLAVKAASAGLRREVKVGSVGAFLIGQRPKRDAESIVEAFDLFMIVLNIDDGHGTAVRLETVDAV